ncbi:hypothetical protein DL93DRAFT_1557632 [Clavulina sp. PMI_390]|nr:hypothetical protein DL93DRAFT_1557632 [Clavulina sp. PMI_390]
MVAALQSLPLELLFQIAETLDVISVIRLSSVSTRLRETIGLSKPFWARYCRNLLQDENIPPLSAAMNSLKLDKLMKLATRKERIIRATLLENHFNLPQCRQTYFPLDLYPTYLIYHWTIQQAPGGRWLLAIAVRVDDETLHLMCWDSAIVGADSEISPLPVTTIQLKDNGKQVRYFDMSQLTYDADLERLYFFVTLKVDEVGDRSRNWRVIPVEMDCPNDGPPSFRAMNHIVSWPYNGQNGSFPCFSGRWGTFQQVKSDKESDYLIWDSKTGQISTYPVEHHQLAEGVFETFMVTHFGTLLHLLGEATADQLNLSISPVSTTTIPASPASFQISGYPKTTKIRGGIHFEFSNLGSACLAHYQTATFLRLKCQTAKFTFTTMIAPSESGAFYELPRASEGSHRDERLAPSWSAETVIHSHISTVARFQTSRGITLELDEDSLLLYIEPYALADPRQDVAQPLLAMPRQPPGLKVQDNDWDCYGVCLRSGAWMFALSRQGRPYVMLIRYD